MRYIWLINLWKFKDNQSLSQTRPSNNNNNNIISYNINVIKTANQQARILSVFERKMSQNKFENGHEEDSIFMTRAETSF